MNSIVCKCLSKLNNFEKSIKLFLHQVLPGVYGNEKANILARKEVSTPFAGLEVFFGLGYNVYLEILGNERRQK